MGDVDGVVYPGKEEWDVLIVLDACRYDYFERLYPEYLSGELEKRLSPGTWSLEWAERSFPGVYDDVVYVSANPYVRNSYISEEKLQGKWGGLRIDPFVSEMHFYKVIDVWVDGWDEKRGTVFPATVNEAAIYAMRRYGDRRYVIHYVQPHSPYLGAHGLELKGPTDRFLESIRWRIVDTLGKERGRRVNEAIGLWPPPSTLERIARRFGHDVLRRLYQQNLKLVLRHVSLLKDYLSGRVVVTSDHGESLGESGVYGHRRDIRTKEVVEIPWLEMHLEKREKPLPQVDYEEDVGAEYRLEDRLEALGYV